MSHDDAVAARIAAQRATAFEHLAATTRARVALASRDAWDDAALEGAARVAWEKHRRALARETQAWKAAKAARAREEATERAARAYVDALRAKEDVERERAAREERIERRARAKRAETSRQTRERNEALSRRFAPADIEVIEMFQARDAEHVYKRREAVLRENVNSVAREARIARAVERLKPRHVRPSMARVTMPTASCENRALAALVELEREPSVFDRVDSVLTLKNVRKATPAWRIVDRARAVAIRDF